jgi:hypothetical protein
MPQKQSAKFAFFYLLSLVGLLFVSLSVGMIIFQIINKYIVDIINQYSSVYSDGEMKFAISAIFISAPVFYLTSRQIYKSLYSGELDQDAGVRKWLSYLILLISSVVMIGWLISVLNSFLDGELTSKSILKAITALSIAGSIFSFYYYDIKRELVQNVKSKVVKIYFYVSLVVVIIVFVASLFVVDSPTKTRNIKIDQEVLNDFMSIDSALNQYYVDNKKMPSNLDELKSELNYITDNELVDPRTKTKYVYNLLEGNKYELCATFLTSNKNVDENRFELFFDKRWLHDAGYQCLKNKVTVLDSMGVPVKM